MPSRGTCNKLQKWACVTLLRLNKAKCTVLHTGWDNPHYQYRLGDEGIESSPLQRRAWGYWWVKSWT